MIRTTLRLQNDLKKAAEERALDESTTLQDIFNRALDQYLRKADKRAAKKIIFKTHNLGEPLDNLRRGDYYPDPK